MYGFQELIYGEIGEIGEKDEEIIKHVSLTSNAVSQHRDLETSSDFKLAIDHFLISFEKFEEILQILQRSPDCKWYLKTSSFCTLDYSGINNGWKLMDYKITGKEYSEMPSSFTYKYLVKQYSGNIEDTLEYIGKREAKEIIYGIKKNESSYKEKIELISKIISILEKNQFELDDLLEYGKLISKFYTTCLGIVGVDIDFEVLKSKIEKYNKQINTGIQIISILEKLVSQ